MEQEPSDITINGKLFYDPSEIDPRVAAANEKLKELGSRGPKWWDVGAEKYREMRRNGQTSFPKPTMLDGVQSEVPSRDSGRKISVRILKPDGDVKIRSVIMYIHGGGWVLMAEDLYDPLLKPIANGTDSLVVSVGYRLAPEHPYPAGKNDCNDVAEWLVDNAEKEFGAKFQFIGGDSAGGNLTMTTYMHLHQTRPNHALSGLINYYGCFDLSRLPQGRQYDGGVVMPVDTMVKFLEAYTAGAPTEDLKDPGISPFYQDLRGFKLPPALFLCGTNDALYDDTAFMSVKWQMNGGEAVTKFWAGVPHGFMSFRPEDMPPQAEGMRLTLNFITKRLR